jgi:tRNA dimethylallyltransferase
VPRRASEPAIRHPADPLDQDTLLFLVGPTASGKSELAPGVARALGAEVLSLDSMLVYRGMDVGTAKPGPELRARVPHHLIDLVGPEERFHVARYAELARAAVRDCQARGVRALFVGGTPLYMQALIFGLFAAAPHEPELRAALEARAREVGAPALHAELARSDPAAAARLHPHDAKRIVRALEVLQQTGRKLSEWQQEWSGSGRRRRIAALLPAPGELERRIPERTRHLLARGWVEEARAIAAGPGFGPSAIQALGYREVLELAAGKIEREACALRIDQKTRQLARRQRTWLRRFPEIAWVEREKATDPAALTDEVLRALDGP